MSKGKKKMEIYGSDIRRGVLHEGGSLNGWKLPILPRDATAWRKRRPEGAPRRGHHGVCGGA
jgi:hypothetical protein